MDSQIQYDLELIENFLDGELSSEGERNVHQRIETDKKFAKLYNFRIKIAKDWQEAAHYEEASQMAEYLIKSAKRNKFRIIVIDSLKVAALIILLIAIPTIIFFPQKTKTPTQIVDKEIKDSIIKQKTYTELPERKASIGFIDTVILESPINNAKLRIRNSVNFRWRPPLDTVQNLIILSKADEKVVYDKIISKGLETYTLDPGILMKGKYYWYIKDLSAKDSFRIVK